MTISEMESTGRRGAGENEAIGGSRLAALARALRHARAAVFTTVRLARGSTRIVSASPPPRLPVQSLVFACCIAAAAAGCGDNQTPAPTRQPYGADAAPLSCAPNLDGVITAQELSPTLDVAANYLVSPQGTQRTVDLVGMIVDGRHQWSFAIDYADDRAATLTATQVAGKWYAASFPTGQFTTPIDAGGTIDGIYVHDDGGMYLLGVASHVENPPEGKTLLVYDQPIPLFKFPLAPPLSWSASGNVSNATLRGLPYAGKDTYEVSDDAVGKLVLHDFTFDQVHRIRTKVTVAPSAGAPTTQFQVSFVGECFGEVTRATSKNNETNPDFTTAAELRRLGQ